MIYGDWTTIGELRDGAVFETQDGIRAMKTEYHESNGRCACYLLESGEAAWFGDAVYNSAKYNAIIVREIYIGETCEVAGIVHGRPYACDLKKDHHLGAKGATPHENKKSGLRWGWY